MFLTDFNGKYVILLNNGDLFAGIVGASTLKKVRCTFN